MRWIILVAILGLASCATAPVLMRNQATGQTAKCGPFSTTDNYGSAEAAAMQERQCIQDYKEQGFVRSAN